jgi:hypothetical protein
MRGTPVSKRSSRNRRQNYAIQAAASGPKEMYICGDSEPLEIQAAETPESPKRFSMVAYTGAAIKVGFGYPVVVDLEGMKIPSQKRPILRGHDHERIVGHTEAVEKTAQRLKVSGVLSGSDDQTAEIIATASKGFPWQASIGASIDRMEFVDKGATVKVNGRNFDGPIYVARATSLGEVSFVTIGADGATSASVAATYTGDSVMTFSEWLKAKGIDEAGQNESVMSALKLAYKAEQLPVTPAPAAPVPPPEVKATGKNPSAALGDVIEAQRKENARVEGITELVARYAKDQPRVLDAFEEIGKQAIEAGWDVDKVENKLTMASIKAGSGPTVIIPSRPQVTGDVLEASLCLSLGLNQPEKAFDERILHAADKQYGRAMGLQELVDVCAAANGYRGSCRRNLNQTLRAAFSDGINASATPSTLSISSILSNVANKFVREAFMYVEMDWKKLAATRSVRDFKQISSYSLTGDLTYRQVGPGGEIEHGTLGDEAYNNQAKTYALMLGISRNDLINDDLGALQTVTKRLGRGGALKLTQSFWTTFMDNSTFFTTGNSNYDDGTDTALTNDGLVAADILWAAMTDPDGNPMGGKPKYLVVPANLRIAAWRLMNSQFFTAADEEGENNPWAGAFEVVSSDYLNNTSYTGYSTKAWYWLRDPNEIPTIEVCYLNGQEMPTIESADLDFNRLGIAFRGYHDFGITKQEPRGGFKFKGEA